MLNLITDRSQAHVNRLLALQNRGWANMTAAEQEAWYGEIAKGAYNYTDLNRVETAVGVLARILNMSLTTKTNWTMWDKPTQSDMSRYLGNVAKIRERCSFVKNLPTLPTDMNNLNYKAANNIELVLLRVYEYMESCVQAGEIYSGEV